MAEQEPRVQQAPQLHLPEGSSLRLTDGTNELDVRKDGETLLLHVSRAEHSLFSIAVLGDGQVHQVFHPASTTSPAGHLLAAEGREAAKPPEYPPITVEGFTGRSGSYRQSEIRPGEMEYYVYLYYRPAPDENWGFTIPYHVHFFGDLAEQLKEQKMQGGSRFRVTGELHTRHIKSKQGGEPKTQYDVYATGYEFFKGKPKPMEGETRKKPA